MVFPLFPQGGGFPRSNEGFFRQYLAQQGYTANSGAFEHKQGFFNVFNGEGNYDAGKILVAGSVQLLGRSVTLREAPAPRSAAPP